MKSLIRLLLIISGISTNIYTAYILSKTDIHIIIQFCLVISNVLALTWAVVLREVFGWNNPMEEGK